MNRTERKTKKEIHRLLHSAQSYERDKKLVEYQNKFVEKSNINRRLFDVDFMRCSQRPRIGIDKRQHSM